MGGGGKGGRGLWTLGEGARGGMGCGVNHDWCYWPQNFKIYLMAAVFSHADWLLGHQLVLVLVNSFGALTAVTGETEMKVCMEQTGGLLVLLVAGSHFCM